MVLILVLAVLFLLFFVFRRRKKLNLADVTMFTGGVKTGKTTTGLHRALLLYRKALLKWRVSCFFAKIFRKPLPEKPLFYSNIPLKIDYVPMTEAIFMRKERMAFKSVSYVDEASLIADSMDWKDPNINENLKMFNKLYGHETHGGKLIYTTHVMRDVHYAIKRCMNNYIWIHHAIKWIPFVYIVQVREMFFSEEGENINVSTDDVDEQLKWLIIPKSVWKKFDCYCYSVFTDDLPVANKVHRAKTKKDLKCDYIVDVSGKNKR